MIIKVRIYKEDGRWIVEVRSEWLLPITMTQEYVEEPCTHVGTNHYDSWTQAVDFVFGPGLRRGQT